MTGARTHAETETTGTMPLTHTPDHVLVAGCWHARGPWAVGVVDLLRRLLPDEPTPLVVHTGDFGVWRGRDGRRYLDQLDDALVRAAAELWFVDGNHEDFPYLRELAGTDNPRGPVQIRDTIHWMPRGHRWTWHGRTWLAMGGAVSVDRSLRREGWDWFADESITEGQIRGVAADGPVDVMISHDTPMRVPLRLPPPSRSWAMHDLARADAHRERLQDLVDQVRPELIVHGHYHLHHDTTVAMGHGPVRVLGLDMDGAVDGNHRVVDTRTLAVLDPRPSPGAPRDHLRP